MVVRFRAPFIVHFQQWPSSQVCYIAVCIFKRFCICALPCGGIVNVTYYINGNYVGLLNKIPDKISHKVEISDMF